MVLAISDDQIFTIIITIFVPLVTIVIKMFLQMRHNQIKIEEIDSLVDQNKDLIKRVSAIENELSGLREKIIGLSDVLARTRDYVLENKNDIDSIRSSKTKK